MAEQIRVEEQYIIDGLIRGDLTITGEFYDRYFQTIYNFVFFRVGKNREDAEDITQECLIKIFRNVRNYKGQGSLFAWMTVIAKNCITDYYRRGNKKRLETVLANCEESFQNIFEDLEHRPLPGQVKENPEVQDMVRSTLSSIPPQFGQLLVWKYVENLSVEEISRREKKSYKSVESLLYRARQIFKDSFQTALAKAI